MLASICGSKSVERILLFLFVNERCYGAQLQRFLQTSLTPLQKALLNLEESGLLISFLQGKTKIYQFNPSYPLLDELLALLRKAYTLLSPIEKKPYTFVKNTEDSIGKIAPADKQKAIKTLMDLWRKLKGVKSLVFSATTKAKSETGWNGKGRAEVQVTNPISSVLVFQEKGTWKNKQEQEIDFFNVFRWTLDLDLGAISLEHLRRGVNHPVFLFHLSPSGDNIVESIDSHLCGLDTYLGRIRFDANTLQFCWRVIGPQKNEEIDYYYS